MIKHSSIYAIGNISRQMVGFIMLPIYTQYLSPADYGIIGLLTFALSMIDIFFGARLAQAVPKYYHDKDDDRTRNSVISTALILTASISLVSMLFIIYFSAASSSLIFGSSDYSLVVSIYTTLLFTQAIENYGLLYIRLQQKPFLFLAFNLTKLALQLSLNIWLVVFLEMGVMGIAITAAISFALSAAALLVYTLYYTRLHWSHKIAKQLVAFSWPLWVAGFAGLYLAAANRYYMRIFGSLDDVGLYELAAKFQLIVVLMIWRPINQYWQTERFKHYKPNEPTPRVFQSVFLALSTILIIASLGVSILSEPVIKIMATPVYFESATIVPILTLAALFSCAITFMNFSMFATENTKWISKNNYIVAAVASVFFLALIPYFGYLGAAIAYLLAIVLQLIMTARASGRYYNMGLKFKPVIYMILVSTLGYGVSNKSLHLESFAFDLGFKLISYTVFSIMILMIMWYYTDDKEYIRGIYNKIRKRNQPEAN